MQSFIEIPDGYRAVISPSPKALRCGVAAVSEEHYGDERIAAGSNTVVVEFSKNMGHIYYRSKDFLRIERGQILAVLKISPVR